MGGVSFVGKDTNCRLTVFLVEEDLHLLLGEGLEGHLDRLHGLLVGEVAAHESARAALLHDLGAVVAGQLAETLVAEHDRVVDDPSVRQDEIVIC